MDNDTLKKISEYIFNHPKLLVNTAKLYSVIKDISKNNIYLCEIFENIFKSNILMYIVNKDVDYINSIEVLKDILYNKLKLRSEYVDEIVNCFATTISYNVYYEYFKLDVETENSLLDYLIDNKNSNNYYLVAQIGEYNNCKLYWDIISWDDQFAVLVLDGNVGKYYYHQSCGTKKIYFPSWFSLTQNASRYGRKVTILKQCQWKTSDLRKMLNTIFYNNAFNDIEKMIIYPCDYAMNNSIDYVFIPDESIVKHYRGILKEQDCFVFKKRLNRLTNKAFVVSYSHKEYGDKCIIEVRNNREHNVKPVIKVKINHEIESILNKKNAVLNNSRIKNAINYIDALDDIEGKDIRLKKFGIYKGQELDWILIYKTNKEGIFVLNKEILNGLKVDDKNEEFDLVYEFFNTKFMNEAFSKSQRSIIKYPIIPLKVIKTWAKRNHRIYPDNFNVKNIINLLESVKNKDMFTIFYGKSDNTGIRPVIRVKF